MEEHGYWVHERPVVGLPGNFDNALAWGDFNNDARLDFLLAGTIEGDIVSQLWRNSGLTSNSPPAAPEGLSALVSGTSVELKWNAPLDDHTPAAGLSYNLRVGTTPGASDVLSAPALPNGQLLVQQMGASRNGSAVLHQLKSAQTYYWSVQAVDPSFAGSPFAIEQQFSTAQLVLNSSQYSNGIFAFSFTGTPGATYTALATTNASLVLTNWTALGSASEISPGHFRFADAEARDNPSRFYRVRSP